MRRKLLGILAVVTLAGCMAQPPPSPSAVSPESPAAPIKFHSSIVSTASYAAEPSFVLAPDHATYICSPHGIAQGTDVWKGSLGNDSFQPLGTEPVAGGPVLRSGSGNPGGGDCNVGVDGGGRVYLADLWEGGISVESTGDNGTTWRGAPLSIAGAAPLDRPWILGGKVDEVFVEAAQIASTGLDDKGVNMPPLGGIWVARSTDGGLTFPQSVLAVGNQDRLGLNGNLVKDDQGLYFAYVLKKAEGRLALMVAQSTDDGRTWMSHPIAEQNYYPKQCFGPLEIFPILATDGAGGVYAAWALINPDTQRIDLFMATSRDHAQTWEKPINVANRAGTREYPWIDAQGPGRVGLVWYETNETHVLTSSGPATCSQGDTSSTSWFLHYAYSADAFESSPTFSEALVQPTPITNGSLGNPLPMEVLQVRFTPDGRAMTAYVADTPQGGERPMFAVQVRS